MNGNPLTRIASIDILRALTMVLMIFVNDLWSLKGIPNWLEHTQAEADGMGLADVVFPAFLVIVGMSVPFAVDSRRKKGQTDTTILAHTVQRGFALIIMGVFLVNGETLNPAATGIPGFLWYPLACLCFIVLFNSYPKNANRFLVSTLKFLAWLTLAVMAWIFRGGEQGNERFTTSWWGILGLIGWAYLLSSVIFLFAGRSLSIMCLVWTFFIAFLIASHAGLLPAGTLVKPFAAPFGDGAMPAFVTGGIICSMLFERFRAAARPYTFIICIALISLVLLCAGVYLRSFWGISKIRATPAWVLICSSITFICFTLIFWLADLKNKDHWFRFIRPAGTNTLLCYLLPYFAYALLIAIGFSYPDTVSTGIPGLIKSFLFSLVIVQLAGLLGKAGVRLKL